ncbi:MAG: hypothetical protein RBR34_12190 [Rhodospirillaceae bacterium]|nr:hypothetical protein [Rhodospirillaceae bacterium]
MTALDRCAAAITAMAAFHRDNQPAIDALGRQARRREQAGEPRSAVMPAYARALAALYSANDRKPPAWTQPYLSPPPHGS